MSASMTDFLAEARWSRRSYCLAAEQENMELLVLAVKRRGEPPFMAGLWGSSAALGACNELRPPLRTSLPCARCKLMSRCLVIDVDAQ